MKKKRKKKLKYGVRWLVSHNTNDILDGFWFHLFYLIFFVYFQWTLSLHVKDSFIWSRGGRDGVCHVNSSR